MPGGRASMAEVVNTIVNALNARWGTGEWILSAQETGIYLNYETVATKRLTLVEVEEEAARAKARNAMRFAPTKP